MSAQRKNEAGRIAAIRAAYAEKRRAGRKASRLAVLFPQPPANRVEVRCEFNATMAQIEALGPERCRAFLLGVAKVISANGAA